MAGKTPTELLELINAIKVDAMGLSERVSAVRNDLDRFNFIAIRERLTAQETLVAELKKQFEEKDRRWWQFWAGVGLVGFTFLANLLIQLFLLFSRKPA